MGKNRSRLDLMCREEAEEYMASLKKKLPRPFSIGILPNGEPFFAIPKEYIVENEDGTVSWSAREICVGLHPFIELTTGQGEKKRTVYLPFCLVNPRARLFAAAVARTTIDPIDGRYCSKPAELYIVELGGRRAFKIHVSLGVLPMQLFVASILGPAAARFKSEHCVFCTAKEFVVLPPERGSVGDESPRGGS